MAKSLKMRLLRLPSRSGGYVAICLEHCLIAQAKTDTGLLSEFRRVALAHAREAIAQGLDPFVCLPAASPKYQMMWETAEPSPTVVLVNLREELAADVTGRAVDQVELETVLTKAVA